MVVVEIDVVVGIKVVERDFAIFCRVESCKFTPVSALQIHLSLSELFQW